MANRQENVKTEGNTIINDMTQNLIEIDNCKIDFLYFWKCRKNENNIKKYEKEYTKILQRVIEYNKKIDNLFPLFLSQNTDTVCVISIFNLQREQIQNLLNEFASNISSKRMQLNFLRSLIISVLAIIVAVFSLIIKIYL